MKKSLIAIACASSALALLLSACGGTESSDTDGGNSSQTQTMSPSAGDGADDSPSEASSTFENGVLTTPDVKIEITRYKVIGVGKKGNEYGEKPVIAYWYKTTNVSGKKTDATSAWMFTFNGFQDNNPNAENELNFSLVFGIGDEKFPDSHENIKKGGTVENAVAYDLDDLVTPVDLVAAELFGDVIGKTTYKLS